MLREIELDGRTVRLTEWPQEAPERTIVAWPGLGADRERYFDRVGPLLAKAGLRVLAVQAPDDPRLEALAALACRLLTRVSGTPVVFVGASWGAVLGLRLAATCPERLAGLVLVDGGYQEPTDALPRPLRHPKLLARAVVRALTRRQSAALREAAATSPEALYQALARAGVPTLLLAAGGSRGLDRIGRAVPQLRVVELDSGHDLLGEAPEEVAAAILAWRAAR